MTTSDRVRLILTHLSITQSELARSLGVTRSYITKLLSDDNRGKRTDGLALRAEKSLGLNVLFWSDPNPQSHLESLRSPRPVGDLQCREALLVTLASLYRQRAAGVHRAWLEDCIARCEREIGGGSCP